MNTKLFLTSLMLGASVCAYSQWTQQANIPQKIAQEGAVAHPNGNVYVFAGYDTTNTEVDSLFIFNQLANTWSRGAVLPHSLRAMGYALGPDSLIYSMSGTDAINYTDSCYSYNTKTNKWTAIAVIPTPVWYPAAATGSNGKIYVFGGENPGPSYHNQVYDPKTNTWDSAANLPQALLGESAIAAANGKIYLMGGMDSNSVVTDSVEVFDPVANTWSYAAHMPTARHQFGYAIDENGDIYCIGGKTQYGNENEPFLNVVEIYHPSSNTWTMGDTLPHGLGELAAAGVNNGINVFGGVDSATGHASSYNYRINVISDGVAPIVSTVGFSVYPNPSSGVFNITITKASTDNVTVRVMDVMGQVCYNQSWNGIKAGNSRTVDLSGFSKGMYFMEFTSDNTKTVKKLIIQ
jgi:N-acetylneuraminic acid mutarotase